MTPPPRPGPGDTIAERYVLHEILGEGGMGVVYKAFHVELKKVVAIKLLLSSSHASPVHRANSLGRFMREARAAASLTSEHAVQVHDYGKLPGENAYLVMDYVDGRNLREELRRRGRLPVSEAVDYVLQACDALAEAHAGHTLHRDLKPANLVLTHRAGEPLVKVVDFGLAIRRGVDDQLTGTRETIGTPDYMSPEQIQAFHNVDARADVWSMGVVLYELLTAQLPFEADTDMALMMKICSDPPTPPRRHRPDLPDGLEPVILRCLARDLRWRVQNVAELARALREFVTEPRAAQRAALLVKGIESQLALPAATAPIEPPAIPAPIEPPTIPVPVEPPTTPAPIEPAVNTAPIEPAVNTAPIEPRERGRAKVARWVAVLMMALVMVSALLMNRWRDRSAPPDPAPSAPPVTLLPSIAPTDTTTAAAPPSPPPTPTAPPTVLAPATPPPAAPLKPMTTTTSTRLDKPPLKTSRPACKPNGSFCGADDKVCCSGWCATDGCTDR